MSFEDFTEMPVWQSGFDLLLKVYRLAKTFPGYERVGLASDMRRAANATVHNIAEGFGRYEPGDKTRLYKISRGSAYELASQILVAYSLEYITDGQSRDELIGSCKKVIMELNALIKRLES
ncbi:MAG: four helix bundle protein [Thermodesulfobacteriota bacterium]